MIKITNLRLLKKGTAKWMFNVFYVHPGGFPIIANHFRVLNKKIAGPAVKFGPKYQPAMYLDDAILSELYVALVEKIGADELEPFEVATEMLCIKRVTLATYAPEVVQFYTLGETYATYKLDESERG